MNQLRKKSFWQSKAWFLLATVIIVVGWASQQVVVQDFWRGMGYKPEGKMQEIEAALELTGRGRQIFAASWPAIGPNVEFNDHCNSHNGDVSLLGCYTGGRIYVYEVELEELETGNIVTTAHELLHAVWERMSERERGEVRGWLDKLYAEKKEWFDKELEVYTEGERVEEMYARVGTKLAELPEEAEANYSKFFQNRGRIVEYYERYEAPFLELKAEMEELLLKIENVRAEIDQGKEEYSAKVKELEGKIETFNRCAETVGCFRNEVEFSARRQALVAETGALDGLREELNKEIEENNRRIDQYRELQAGLGRLNDAVNSNIELIEKTR